MLPPRRGEKRVAGGKRSAATGTIWHRLAPRRGARVNSCHRHNRQPAFFWRPPRAPASRIGCIRWPRFACHRLPSTRPSGAAQPKPTFLWTRVIRSEGSVWNLRPKICHPERSEGPSSNLRPSSYTQRVLRFAQDDGLRFLLSLAARALSEARDDTRVSVFHTRQG